jgi:hypothetical protein
MRKHFNLFAYFLILFTAFALIISCNNRGDDKKAAENSVADTSNKTPDVSQEQPRAMAIAGTLDFLYIDAAEFLNLPKAKLVFSFAFRTNDTLTLYGWSCKNNGVGNCTGTYNNDPNIKLIKYQTGTKTYGPEVFFGNVIIQKDDVKTIKSKIGAYKYVVFVPENRAGFIYYTINVTDDPPAPPFIKTLALTPTGIITNPSPPKDY